SGGRIKSAGIKTYRSGDPHRGRRKGDRGERHEKQEQRTMSSECDHLCALTNPILAFLPSRRLTSRTTTIGKYLQPSSAPANNPISFLSPFVLTSRTVGD